MKRNVGKAGIDVSRRLKDTAFALRLYSIWAILIFLVFGLLGIYPQARILVKGIQTGKEMREVNKSLRNKIDLINQEALKIDNNTKGVEALNRALPADYEVQNYVVDLSFAVSKTGYNLTAFQAEGGLDTGQGITVSAKLEGNGSVSELIKSIESSGRAAQVNEVSFVEGDGVKVVAVLLDIYVLK